MSENLKLEISTITMVHVIAIVLSVIIWMIFYTKARKTAASKSLLVLQLSVLVWMIFKVVKTVAPTITIRWLAIVAYYIGASVLELAFLNFAYANYKGKSLNRKVFIPLSVIVAVQIIVIATNPFHYLFYKTFNFFHDSFGPLFYVHTLIEYGFIAVGFVYCTKTFKVKLQDKSRVFRILVSSAIVIPLIMNLIYISKLLHRWIKLLGLPVVFDVTPIVFSWSIIIFVYATYKSDFLDLTPVMKHEIVHRLVTPVIVFDEKMMVCFKNDAMNQYESSLRVIQESLKESYQTFQKFSTEIHMASVDLLLRCQEVTVGKRKKYYIVTVTDVSSYKQVERALIQKQMTLDESNRALESSIKILKGRSKISARNYVAREMHDILGHALVATIKLLEVAQLYENIDLKVSTHAIEDAKTLIVQGISDMNEIRINKKEQILFSQAFIKKDFKSMIDLVNHGDLQCHLSIKGNEENLDEHVYVTIKRVTKELITNALKHGNATSIFIGLDIQRDELVLKVLDNGCGSETVIEGNGLKGIKERLKEFGGHFDYSSSHNEGFVSKIIIPT